ncbi:hypothetical protein gp33 [Burkholderia phage KS9]|uniref:HNH endonuclease n=1 Tax=Burkholderia phage KS9 TaxID=335797 RepID=UPI0001B07E42|nr:HNH endonuclease [Burkholderia sp. BCC0322]YP_003090160.1 HNH endonuclease [Burkholderia phage KS9]ACT82997.1 hypothetical protein gp33 [Burkholderia phage KS9]
MIKLDRPGEPLVLKTKSSEWTLALTQAVAKFGSYKNIPDAEKEYLLSHYRHQDIKTALTASSHGKCAFCECIPSEGGYVAVEHFKPKSIYPSSTFEWSNLLPACSQCNGSKLDHDTVVEPIVNPYDIDPIDIFRYDGISMKPNDGPHYDLAKKTIETCGLETIRLWKPRADILVSLAIFSNALVDAMGELLEADTSRKKTIRLRKLSEALQTIESLMHPSSKFSAFCRDYLEKSEEYRKAKNLVAAGSPNV